MTFIMPISILGLQCIIQAFMLWSILSALSSVISFSIFIAGNYNYSLLFMYVYIMHIQLYVYNIHILVTGYTCIQQWSILDERTYLFKKRNNKIRFHIVVKI